jgi:4-hydroxybenzoate polyprenyltransferase
MVLSMDIKAINRLLLIKQTLFGLTWLGSSALLPYLQANRPAFCLRSWLLLLVAFLTARFSGMCFNSLFDRSFDAINPRTKDRPLPTGDISPVVCAIQAVLFLAVFLCASWSINPLCGLLSLAVGLAVVLYSLTKRITPLCHFALATIYFFAPFCAWAAVTGEISLMPFLFSLALFLTIAGSDIIYACQDIEFDRKIGLFSMPALLGQTRALVLAAFLHTLAVGALLLEGYMMDSLFLTAAGAVIACVSGFCYLKMVLGQISYMAAFSRINMFSGMILFVFILADLLF